VANLAVKMTTTPSFFMWIDPGLTTGWAMWYPATYHFYSGNVTGLIPAAAHVQNALRLPSRRAAIGWEPFAIRPGSSRLALDTTALEVIGAVKWIAYALNATVLPPSQPSDRKLGELHLRTLGWHRPGPDHADSAASHLLSYLLRERLLPADLLAKITRKQEEEES
jgi:hypothetical protein